MLSDPFTADWNRLTKAQQRLFREAVARINAAYAGRGSQRLPHWPASLRIKAIRDHPGIWEMTWSFAGPDGRATFEFIDINGEPAIKWRRIGDHRIFDRP